MPRISARASRCVLRQRCDFQRRCHAHSTDPLTPPTRAVLLPPPPPPSPPGQVELKVTAVHCVSRAAVLPFEVVDASRSAEQIRRGQEAGEQWVTVNQDTRLDNRTIDLRTPANQAIFRLQSAVTQVRAWGRCAGWGGCLERWQRVGGHTGRQVLRGQGGAKAEGRSWSRGPGVEQGGGQRGPLDHMHVPLLCATLLERLSWRP